ncbi:MAG TPA: site-specific integrase [Hanamia sp.]|nr:site-specific integrase [Hanamia sp.]
MTKKHTNELMVKINTDQQLIAQAELDTLAKNYIQQSLSASTRKFYSIDLGIFAQWCDSLGLIPLPSTPDTVARFLAAQASLGIKPATLIRRLAAIRMAHEMQGYATPTQHKGVKAVLKGIKREKGIAQKKKAPATAERIEHMIAYCSDTLTGLRDKALLLLGFAGAFRRSELVALKVNDIERTPEGIKVTIRKSKTDQEGQGQMIAILNGSRLRVVDALMAWLDAANITEGYLFRPIKKGGKVQLTGLTDRSVANIVKFYAGKLGLTVDDFSGHSLRSGFITSGAAAGADLFKLMEVSRHKKPETIIGYVRESKLFENHAGEKFL